MVALKINAGDNVAVAIETIPEGTQVYMGDDNIITATEIPAGHKMALRDLQEGEPVIKYGYPIGHTQTAVRKGGWIHTHNLMTGLSDLLTYTYEPVEHGQMPSREANFDGFDRGDGTVGVRNEIWIIPAVGCQKCAAGSTYYACS